MSEPMDTREEVELPPLEITDEDEKMAEANYGRNRKDLKGRWLDLQSIRQRELCRERQLKASLAANREQKAEIERLKVELAKTGTGDYKGDFYLGRKTLSGYLRDAEDDRDGWKRLYDAEKAELASLRASVGEKPEDAWKRGYLAHARIYAADYGIYLDGIAIPPYIAPPTLPTEKEVPNER